jgi:hypothetical protein
MWEGREGKSGHSGNTGRKRVKEGREGEKGGKSQSTKIDSCPCSALPYILLKLRSSMCITLTKIYALLLSDYLSTWP